MTLLTDPQVIEMAKYLGFSGLLIMAVFMLNKTYSKPETAPAAKPPEKEKKKKS